MHHWTYRLQQTWCELYHGLSSCESINIGRGPQEACRCPQCGAEIDECEDPHGSSGTATIFHPRLVPLWKPKVERELVIEPVQFSLSGQHPLFH